MSKYYINYCKLLQIYKTRKSFNHINYFQYFQLKKKSELAPKTFILLSIIILQTPNLTSPFKLRIHKTQIQ